MWRITYQNPFEKIGVIRSQRGKHFILKDTSEWYNFRTWRRIDDEDDKNNDDDNDNKGSVFEKVWTKPFPIILSYI